MNTTGILFGSNKVRDIEVAYLKQLRHLYPEEEIKMFVRMLFEAFLGWNQVQLLTRKEETINQSDLLHFHWALEDLKRHRPIQYIIGHTDFCGCRITVDESVLIPRPETEEIVNRTIEMLSQCPPSQILDLCTGSGCIAIAFAKAWPKADVWAVDISNEAISVAEKNALSNNVKINYLQADILKPLTIQNTKFDLIISNPPYIRDIERGEIQHNVLDWEPSQALFVDDNNPLIFYFAIAALAEKCLKQDGLLICETNEYLSEETASAIREKGFSTKILPDFRGKNRMIVAKKRSWE